MFVFYKPVIDIKNVNQATVTDTHLNYSHGARLNILLLMFISPKHIRFREMQLNSAEVSSNFGVYRGGLRKIFVNLVKYWNRGMYIRFLLLLKRIKQYEIIILESARLELVKVP